MAMMTMIVSNPQLMGRFRAKPWLIALGWVGTALMVVAVIVLLGSFLFCSCSRKRQAR
jgi:Mn2+/Fe2+ NRAMP family transporter